MGGSKETNKKIITVVVHAILILMTIVMLVPFIWMILTAFKSVQETTQVDPFVIFPSVWRTASFEAVWEKLDFVLLYKNTLLLILFRVICACLTATMAGYAFGRLNFKGKNALFGLVLFQMMVPSQIFIIPQYLMLWFNRAEFDRFARFKSHGSVREVIDWDEFCKTELPVPSYEEQLAIVNNYKAITDRIELKKQINNNLAA